MGFFLLESIAIESRDDLEMLDRGPGREQNSSYL